ncbi:MAG TPA: NADH-quinone oxidoreductase subunit C [Sporichthyaceae bacterium]|nr:NADH-quinone oxidoreductase subunit C [Sporichthyaceae bacterium]
MNTERIPAEELPARAGRLLADGHRIALIAARHVETTIALTYLFVSGPPSGRTELIVTLPDQRPVVPSIANLSFPGGRFEREMHDLFGVIPEGHPQPRRLVRHHHWPRGWYPMRHDAGPAPTFGDPEGPFPFLSVQGPGVFEIPVGPVHAGLIEPGHFRFSVVGESILDLKARLWFVHRGIEKLFEGVAPAAGTQIAERISGDTSLGHALAYAQAVEEATATTLPLEALRLRAVLLELERMHNHAADIGALCNDVAHGVLHSHAQRIRESLLRINDRTTGHRLLRGAVTPGAVTVKALPDPDRLEELAADLAQIVSLALSNSTVLDRFTGTAILTPADAAAIGTLGYVARASGHNPDARIQHPTCDLGPAITPAVRDGGDVLSRFLVRAEEFATSVTVVRHLLDGLRPGTHGTALGRSIGSGTGLAEGWRGTITHHVQLDPDGCLGRVKVVDPSFLNWPALPVALAGAIVPDFPLANKSFNLSYAGNDL